MKRYTPIAVGITTQQETSTATDVVFGSTAGRRMRYVASGGHLVLPNVVRELDVAVVHAHFGVEGVYGLPTSATLRKPLVVTVHGFDAALSRRRLATSRNPTWMYYAANRKRMLVRASAVVCVSEHVARRVREITHDQARISVINTGVRVPDLLSESHARNGLVHVGRLVPKKGTMQLLNAFAEVAHVRPGLTLTIVGDGPELPSLRARATMLELHDRVQFLGHQPNGAVRSLMSSAMAVVIPSQTSANGDQEGLPTTVLEAQAAGAMVIATRHAGIPEAVEHGVTGLLCQEADVRGLATAIQQCLDSPQLREELASRAYENVRKSFNVETQTERLEQLYDQVVRAQI